MSYWWVNHKQTFSSEIEGGYIWSPKENSNGAKNQTYLNLTLTKPGDIVFSYADTKIKAIGVVTAHHLEQAKPSEFGKSGDAWANLGWTVPINWQILTVPIKPKAFIGKIALLLPKKNSPLQINGNGNQGCYLASISDELGRFLMTLASEQSTETMFCVEADVHEVIELKIVKEIEFSNIESTEKEQLIKARKGQGKFRQNVKTVEQRCRVTGVALKHLLIASHIKPWKVSNNIERLDGNNGLLLSPHIDKLFDQGWISFQDNGDLSFATAEIANILKVWGVKLPLYVGFFSESQKFYLKYHRNSVFNA